MISVFSGILKRCCVIVILSKRSGDAAKDLSEPREVSRSLRHNNRAFGSLP